MLLFTEKFKTLVEGATLFLDTNVFIFAQENDKLRGFLTKIKNKQTGKTAIVTAMAVVYEYTRGSQSLQELSSRRKFIEILADNTISMSKLVENSEKGDVFSVVMSLVNSPKNSQYTDYVLAAMLNTFSGSSEKCYVLSSDMKAFPRDIFNIVGSIMIERSNGEARHLHLIELDAGKYNSLIEAKLA